jgi:serine/threonine protein kinase
LRFGKVSVSVVARIGRQLADALHALHSATSDDGAPLAMVHRDVTPSNIILGIDGDARLIDLGIARSAESRADRTGTGFLRGKVKYLAPELFSSPAYSPASDVWALGVVLMELALGRSAVRGGRAEAVARIVAGRLLELEPNESLDPRLHRVLARLLEPDPARRPNAKETSVLFSMMEKDFGDTRAAACLSLPPLDAAALIAPPSVLALSGDIPAIVGDDTDIPWASVSTVVEVEALDLHALPTDVLRHAHGHSVAHEAFEADASGPATPRELIFRYVAMLRGFEALPHVT